MTSTDLHDTTFVFQGGGTYPKDSFIETELQRRLPGHFIGHRDVLRQHNGGKGTNDLWSRVKIMQSALAGMPAGKVVVIGRSSGARVATLLASRPDCPPALRAVACVAYPFRHPHAKGPEPERTAHLSTLEMPTLIVQGSTDPYGGASVGTDYALAEAIRLVIMDTNHEMQLPAEGWDLVAASIREVATRSFSIMSA